MIAALAIEFISEVTYAYNDVSMAIVIYATKAGGLWLLGTIEIGDRTESGLEGLPGAILVAIVAPELVDGGPAEWAAAVATAIIIKTENLLITLGAALVTVILLRGT